MMAPKRRKRTNRLTGIALICAALGAASWLATSTIQAADNSKVTETVPTTLTPWSKISPVRMKGDLKIFWAVEGGTEKNAEAYPQALKFGFNQVFRLGHFNPDPVMKASQDKNGSFPWLDPKLEQLNREDAATRVKFLDAPENPERGYPWFLNTEYGFVAQDATVNQYRKKLGANFEAEYYKTLAKWYQVNAIASKKGRPDRPVGIYGVQPANVWMFSGWKNQTEEQVRSLRSHDRKLWAQIAPYVDYAIADSYLMPPIPRTGMTFEDSYYYVAFNVEENYQINRQFGNKPVYAFLMMRYHLTGEEVNPLHAEMMAIVPFFSGAKGAFVWGYEPDKALKPPYFKNMPRLMKSFNKVAQVSDKLSKAELVIDTSAHRLWRQKAPLVRKMRVSNTEWVVMAAYPFQAENAKKQIKTSFNLGSGLGNRTINLEVRGKHTEVYHIVFDQQNAKVKRID